MHESVQAKHFRFELHNVNASDIPTRLDIARFDRIEVSLSALESQRTPHDEAAFHNIYESR